MNTLHLIVMALACWRLANLLANENGPAHMFLKIRRRTAVLEKKHKLIADFHLYELVECEWCNSIWFGTLITVTYLLDQRAVWVLLPLALSTVTILIKFMRESMEVNNNLRLEAISSMKLKPTKPAHLDDEERMEFDYNESSYKEH